LRKETTTAGDNGFGGENILRLPVYNQSDVTISQCALRSRLCVDLWFQENEYDSQEKISIITPCAANAIARLCQ